MQIFYLKENKIVYLRYYDAIHNQWYSHIILLDINDKKSFRFFF